VVKELPKIGDGKYKNELWCEATKKKLEIILEIINARIDDIFIFSDVDVQFFGPLTDLVTHHIYNNDIVTQKDPSKDHDVMYCTGFMAIRICPRMREFFENVLALMEENPELDDQDAFNEVARISDIRINTFDDKAVWSHRKMWKPNDGQELEVPDDIIVHHANWVYSIEHKAAQLEEAINIYRKRFGNKFLMNRIKDFRDREIVEIEEVKTVVDETIVELDREPYGTMTI
jgi:hypothetical protein